MTKEHHASSILYSTMSIAIVLFLLSVYGLLFLHANNVTNLIKENINIIVELVDENNDNSQKKVFSFVDNLPGVKEGSVTYIPKENAANLMAEFLNDFSEDVDLSPFRNVITYNLEANQYSEDLIKEHEDALNSNPAVLNVFAENETIHLVKSNIQNVSYITLIIGLVLVILALAIVYNTIKLKLHSDRIEIKTMQLVGAKRGFIARPYIQEAIRIAGGAFLIVVIFISIMFVLLLIGIPGISEIINWIYVGIVMSVVFLVGLILTVGIARFVVKGYLDSKTNDLL